MLRHLNPGVNVWFETEQKGTAGTACLLSMACFGVKTNEIALGRINFGCLPKGGTPHLKWIPSGR